ncbi:hypothetical protein BG261_02520 [Floricoccus tropicus]|uniref:LysM domain-containing protein n=1 Tax=Floricoccus tropicus TaxID=1859473 RepID=A0A1E8GMJ7_9LACT|nr:CAP domain-containing protein [Floricoccus tropicus]OFI49471.1 hypothetical protein BG261_02520 [Floricoccus tropicus]
MIQVNSNSNKDQIFKHNKVRKTWMMGVLTASTILAAVATGSSANADTNWVPTTIEGMKNSIKSEDGKYTFKEGDTFWVISEVLNIKVDRLMEWNGFKPGEEFSIPVGTTIFWDGNHIVIKDNQGETVANKIVTSEDKVNPEDTVAGQVTDTPVNSSVNNLADYVTTSNDNDSANVNTKVDINSESVNTNVDNSSTQKDANPDIEKKSQGNNNSSTIVEGKDNSISQTENEKKETEKQKEELENHKNELEKQKQELEQQKKEAEEKLTEILNNSNNQTKEEIDKNVADAQEKVNQATENLESVKSRLLEVTNKFDEATKINEKSLQDFSQTQYLVNTSQEKVNDLLKQIENLKSKIDVLSESNEATDGNDSSTENNEATDGNDSSTENNDKNVDLSLLKDNLEQLKSELNIADSALKDNANKLIKAQADLNASQDNLDSIKLEKGNIESELVDAQSKLDDAQKTLSEVPNVNSQSSSSEAEALQNKLTEYKEKLASLVGNINTVDNKIIELEQLLKELSKKISDEQLKSTDSNTSLEDTINKVNEDDKNNNIDEKEDEISKIQDKVDSEQLRKELYSSKEKAKKDILNLQYLSTDERYDFVEKINNSMSLDEVNSHLQTALNKDKLIKDKEDERKAEEAKKAEDERLAKELADAKQSAGSSINLLSNLSVDEKAQYIGSIYAAKDLSILKDVILQAQTKDKLNKEEAEKKAAQDKIEKELASVKKDANSQINSLGNLSNKEKEVFISSINKALSTKEITSIILNAQSTDKSNKEIADKKAEEEKNERELAPIRIQAQTTINSLSSISPSEKLEYIQLIKNSKNISEINLIISKAQIKDKTNKETIKKLEEELAKSKSDTQNIINSLSFLTSSEKNRFLTLNSNAKNINDIKSIISQAQLVNKQNEEKQKIEKNLELSKIKAKDSINSLGSLNTSEKNNFLSLLTNAKNVSTINDIVNKANEKNRANKIAADKKAAAEALEKELSSARAKAQSLVNSLVNLKASEKNSFINSIKSAKSFIEINSVVNQAQDKDKANKNNSTGNKSTIFDKRIQNLRAQNNARPLNYDSNLQSAADIRAREIVSKFAHVRPNGTSFTTAINNFGSYSNYSENICYFHKSLIGNGSSQDVAYGFWFNSYVHHQSMINPNFNQYAVSFYEVNGYVYAVTLFGTK